MSGHTKSTKSKCKAQNTFLHFMFDIFHIHQHPEVFLEYYLITIFMVEFHLCTISLTFDRQEYSIFQRDIICLYI